MYRRSYYHTDPDRAPVRDNTYKLDDVGQRNQWWQALFPLRTIGQAASRLPARLLLTQYLTFASQKKFEAAREQVARRNLILNKLYAFKAAHDLFQLLELRWSYGVPDRRPKDYGNGASFLKEVHGK